MLVLKMDGWKAYVSLREGIVYIGFNTYTPEI